MRRLAVAATVVALVLAVGCGVPEDDEPQELTADQVPFGLLTTPTTTSQPLQVLPPERRADLYFVDADGQVTPVESEVEDQSAESIITALLEADPQGLDPGLTSNIPPETTLLDIFTDDDVLTVDLSTQFTTIEGPRFIAAVAQVVFTATELAGIRRVAFRQEGEPLPVQDEEGALQDEPVSESDYATLLSPEAG